MTGSVILAAASGYKDMSDGTLRLQVDIEPRFAEAALKLFRERGTPVALARITNEAALDHDRRQHETAGQELPAQDGGVPATEAIPVASRLAASPSDPLPKQKLPPDIVALCAMRCREISFQRFCIKALGSHPAWGEAGSVGDDREDTVRFVRAYCEVQSRRELNSKPRARERWNTLVAEYERWQRAA